MQTAKTKHRPTKSEFSVPVPIEFQVVETVTDVIQATSDGTDTIGQVVDEIVKVHLQDGRQLGRFTIDLSEFSKAFVRPPQNRDRDQI